MMSEFAKKILSGQKTTDEDWSNHLIEAHKSVPSMTPLAFASYKTSEGLNSYQVLAKTLDVWLGKNIIVVDLACGDGHFAPYLLEKIGPNGQLIGIDMVDSEVAIAKKMDR